LIENEFVEIIYPKLIEYGFHITPAKWGEVSQQSKLAHILNGVFPVFRIFEFLENEGQKFQEDFKRETICAIVIHDVLKGIKRDHTDVELKEVKDWVEKLSLKHFYPALNEKDMRAIIAAHMKWSLRKGAILTSDLDPRVLVLVNLADYLSSMETPDQFDVAQRTLEEINPSFMLIYHKISDVRGYITGFIHIVLEEILKEKCGAIPLLYFPNGTVYIGKKEKILKTDLVDPAFSEDIFHKLQKKVEGEISEDLLDNWINPTSTGNPINPLSFFFFSLEKVLDKTKEKQIEIYGRRQEKWGRATTPDQYSQRLRDKGIEITFTEEDVLLAPYFRIVRFILSKIEKKSPIEATLTLADLLNVKLPLSIREQMEKDPKALTASAAFDDCRILAKFYLDKVDPDRTIKFSEIIETLNKKCKEFLKIDSKKFASLIPPGLKVMWNEVNGYLYENLLINGKRLVLTQDDKDHLKHVQKTKGVSMCPICNRATKGIKQFIDFTKVSSQVFTNWQPPWKPKETRKICGVCYIEFVLRNTFFNIDELKDERSYLLLFMFPQYSFTPVLEKMLSEKLEYGLRQPASKFEPDKAATSILEKGIFNPIRYEEFGSVFTWERFFTVLRPRKHVPGHFFLIWNVPKRPEEVTEIEKWFLATYFALLLQQTLDVKVLITQNIYPIIRGGGDIAGVLKLMAPHHFVREVFGENISLQEVEKFTKLAAAMWYCHIRIWPDYPDDKRIAHIFRVLTSTLFPGATLAKRYLRVKGKKSLILQIQKACEILDEWRAKTEGLDK